MDELEKEEIPAHIREARLEALKKQSQDLRLMKEKQHGLYTYVLLYYATICNLSKQRATCVNFTLPILIGGIEM